MTTKTKIILAGSAIVVAGGALWALTNPVKAVIGGAAVAGGAYLISKLRRKKADAVPEAALHEPRGRTP